MCRELKQKTPFYTLCVGSGKPKKENESLSLNFGAASSKEDKCHPRAAGREHRKSETKETHTRYGILCEGKEGAEERAQEGHRKEPRRG